MVDEYECKVIMSHMMQPSNANPFGNIHGGDIMKLIDNAAGAVAMKHSRRPAVTAAIDRLDFHRPVHIGDLLVLKASLNATGRSSMEIGVRVEAENLKSGDVRHIASAYLTFVALDEQQKPAQVPSFEPKSKEAVRRQREAIERRKCCMRQR